MSCSKCHKDKCCCVKIISKTGKRGPRGLTGKPGPPGPSGASGGRVIFESTGGVLITGSINPNATFNVTANLGLSGTPSIMMMWIDASISCNDTHTVTYYFKKNGVMVDFARTRTLGLQDHISFKTGLHSYINTDVIEFYIQSNNATATISNATVHGVKQL